LRTALSGGEWVVLCLHHLLMELQPGRPALPFAMMEGTAQEMLKLDEEKKLFSIFPIRLAATAESAKLKPGLEEGDFKLG